MIFESEEKRERKYLEKKSYDKELTVKGSCSQIVGGNVKESIFLNEEDLFKIFDIIEKGVWKEGTTDCLSDAVISINGRDYFYHSGCGNINYIDTSAALSASEPYMGESLLLSPEEREAVNDILDDYIRLEES